MHAANATNRSAVRLVIRLDFRCDGGGLFYRHRRIGVADLPMQISCAHFGKEKNDCAEEDNDCEGRQVLENLVSGFHA